uniref:Uncharacterized protein n=1 Tax=Arundo donax TaxID=35708 RepID=A0A0A9EKZ6_ARUDO
MVGCKENRHASSSQVSDREHAWNGCPSGYVGNIYTLDVCPYLFGLSSPSWSVDSIVADDPSHSHIEKAITRSSQITCYCCEINLILCHELFYQKMVGRYYCPFLTCIGALVSSHYLSNEAFLPRSIQLLNKPSSKFSGAKYYKHFTYLLDMLNFVIAFWHHCSELCTLIDDIYIEAAQVCTEKLYTGIRFILFFIHQPKALCS